MKYLIIFLILFNSIVFSSPVDTTIQAETIRVVSADGYTTVFTSHLDGLHVESFSGWGSLNARNFIIRNDENASNKLTLTGIFTGNRSVEFPDTNGKVVLNSPLYGGLGTTELPGAGIIPIGTGDRFILSNITGDSGKVKITNAPGSINIALDSGVALLGVHNLFGESQSFSTVAAETFLRLINTDTLDIVSQGPFNFLFRHGTDLWYLPTGLGSTTLATINGSQTFATGTVWNGNSIETTYTDAKVKKLVAGTNVTLSPTSGIGDVTINATGGGSGEINTASNLAGAGVGVWKDKSTYDLRFKRLKGTTNQVTITDNTDSVTVSLPQDIATSSSPSFTTPSFTTGFKIDAAAASGKIPIGNGTNYVASTATFPASVGSSGQIIQASGANAFVASSSTYPTTSAIGDIIHASGSNTYTNLSDVAVGSVFISGGVGVAPSWSASPTLTTSVTVPTIYGSDASGGDLNLISTINATKGNLYFGTSTYDEVNNRLGIGDVTPDFDVDVEKGVTGGVLMTLQNTSAGTGNYAQIKMTAATNINLWLNALSSSWTSSGANLQSGINLEAGGSGGMSVTASNAAGVIRFYTGGTTTKATIDAAGQLGIGLTPAASTGMLQILAANDGTGGNIKINTNSAGVGTGDTFLDFASTDGVIGDISGTAVAGIVAYNTFTGGHYAQLSNEAEVFEVGMLVSATGQLMDNAKQLPLITKTNGRADKRVYGVFAGKIADGATQSEVDSFKNWRDVVKPKTPKTKLTRRTMGVNLDSAIVYDTTTIVDTMESVWGKRSKGKTYSFAKGDGHKDMYQVFAVGTGVCLVTETGGDISVGDLIWSSPIAGLGEKQSDDLVRNSTVAKATENVKWSTVQVVNGVKKKLIAVTYR